MKKIRKRSHCLVLIAAAAAASAALVLVFLWVLGIMLSAVIILFAMVLLIAHLKIAAAMRSRSVPFSTALPAKIIQTIQETPEKISA
jgi:hypothetical protein